MSGPAIKGGEITQITQTFGVPIEKIDEIVNIKIGEQLSGDKELLQKMIETIDKQTKIIAQLVSLSLGADEDTKDPTQSKTKAFEVDWEEWDQVSINSDGTVVSKGTKASKGAKVKGSNAVIITDPKGGYGGSGDGAIHSHHLGDPLELNTELLDHIYRGTREVLTSYWFILDKHQNNPPHPALRKRGKKYTEILRRDMIWKVVLGDMDLSRDAIFQLPHHSLTKLCGIFGIMKSGSKRWKRQRLWLHLYNDPYALNPDTIQDMSKRELHELCRGLDVSLNDQWGEPNNTIGWLLNCVSEVIIREEGCWGKIKKSLRRGSK
jgi:hypothetical protein